MVVIMLYELLERSKCGDQEAVVELIERFKPLLKKYARKLNYEDAYEDLLLNFIEMLNTLNVNSLRARSDAVIVTYFGKAIYSHYIKDWNIKSPA